MENESRFKKWFRSSGDWLQEQAWFQQLRTKWDELDPQSRMYLQFAFGGISAALVLFIAGSFIWNVHSLKKEVAEKSDLVHMIQSANDELRALKESAAVPSVPAGAGAAEPWPNYFNTVAAQAGLGKDNLAVSEEKKIADKGEQAKESLFDINLKKVSIRQVVRVAFSLENGTRPVKLRNLMIDTKDDPTGYMDATLSVSAFTPATGTSK